MRGIRGFHQIGIAGRTEMLTPALKLAVMVAVFWLAVSNREFHRRLIGLPVGAARLRLAATDGDLGQLAAALQAGTGVDARDMGGRTPLYWAAAQNHLEAVKLLLRSGADVNAADAQGFTPLMGAANGGSVDIVRLLLDAGADPTLRNIHGCTARTCAELSGHPSIARMLAAEIDDD
jgi:ankyrin repeat protein